MVEAVQTGDGKGIHLRELNQIMCIDTDTVSEYGEREEDSL